MERVCVLTYVYVLQRFVFFCLFVYSTRVFPHCACPPSDFQPRHHLETIVLQPELAQTLEETVQCALSGRFNGQQLFYAFYAFYAWWFHFPQSGALAEGKCGHGHGVFNLATWQVTVAFIFLCDMLLK